MSRLASALVDLVVVQQVAVGLALAFAGQLACLQVLGPDAAIALLADAHAQAGGPQALAIGPASIDGDHEARALINAACVTTLVDWHNQLPDDFDAESHATEIDETIAALTAAGLPLEPAARADWRVRHQPPPTPPADVDPLAGCR